MLTGAQKRLIADLAEVCQFKANSDLPDWLLPDERDRLQKFLVNTPTIAQLGRYRFALDGRIVDFSPVVQSRPW